MSVPAEAFKPKANNPPVSLLNTLRFYLRLCLDMQMRSAFGQMKHFLGKTKGKLLDVGCGESPYRFLMQENSTQYVGLDIEDADTKFNYRRKDVYSFDGQTIPFESQSFDSILCTEVLEHVENYQKLVDEMYRVLTPRGQALITIPWSARYHYIPYDYFRYTPSTLQKMFNEFSEVKIIPRGTDITSISAKIIVLFVRNILPIRPANYIFIPIWLFFSPIAMLAILMGHISILTGLGNDSDPLGYTILLKK